VCDAGTRWVQTELLEKYPAANLRVYAVWFNMMPNDSREKWPATLLTDSRVIHRWDEPKALGMWFAQRVEVMRPQLTSDSKWGNSEVLWDSFLLYGADSRWGEAPSDLIHWGRTIVASRATLKADFERLFASK
jgi:hypothetical protein